MKTNTVLLSLVLAIVLSVSSASLAIGEGWVDNFEKAKAKAASEGKDLLVDFTGSDWCGWCIKLDKEVFQEESFKTGAPKDFILVALDYPRDKSKMTEDIINQNSKLKDEYGIRGYPTIFLMDAKGRPYAQTGYQAGGPEKYLTHLAELKAQHQKRDEHLAAAKTAKTDQAKAQSLDKAMGIVGMALATKFYTPQVEQIISLDSENEAGLKSKYEQELLRAKVAGLMGQRKYDDALALIQSQINNKGLGVETLIELKLTSVQILSRKKEFDAAVKTVDEVIKEHELTGSALQEALSSKALVYQANRDMENMKKVLADAIKAAPDTPLGKNMKSYLDRMEANEKK